ncbi:hypothetical protein [Morganella morganii]|uniref:hypothetical protein n=1 Tax=Morganella morganii TaxID=582 RepID=UPI000D90C55F|nr:hypothetical protein [Morganella morganii]SPX72043.1 Uncharacterised protein [Morganella morganii]
MSDLIDGEFNPHVYLMECFIRDLFTLAMDDDNSSLRLFRHTLIGDYKCKDECRKIIEIVANSFNHYTNPTEMLLMYLGIDFDDFNDFNDFNDPLLVHRSIDKRGRKILADAKICERGHDIINAAFVMYSLGLKENADRLTRVGMEIIVNDAFKKEFDNLNKEDTIKNGLSDLNRKKASKPRSKYYDEVMFVIKATWEKYPNASQTKLLDKLCLHYADKVTRNTLLNWIKKSGARPPKPKQYSSCKLVHPQ